MKVMRVFIVICCQLLILACGGESSTSDSHNQLIAGKNALGSGHFINPLPAETVNGNILTTVVASDPEGIEQVSLHFNNNPNGLILCQGQQLCASHYEGTHSGINPRDYGVVAGELQLALWVTDSLGQSAEVATVSVQWHPPVLSGITVQRSADGSSATVSWDLNASLLRYNLYLAEVSGVNRHNFTQLAGGQALLAVSSPPQTLQNLSPGTSYYLLVTGLDGSGESAYSEEQIISAIGAPGNSPPVALDDSFTTIINTAITLNVLSNDTDPDGDSLSVVSTGTASGSVTINTDFSLAYTPAVDFVGVDSFTYVIDDGNGNTSEGNVAVIVNPPTIPVNNPTVAIDDSFTTIINTAITLDVLSNDTDPDGDSLSVVSTGTASGSVTINTDFSLAYTPALDFVGVDSFTYVIDDGNGNTSEGNVTVTVNPPTIPVNSPPVAIDDSFTTIMNTAITLNVLSNDSDPEGDSLSVVSTGTASGSVTINTDFSLAYTPPVDFVGMDSFTYVIDDGNSNTSEGNVTVTIISANVPIATDDYYDVEADTPLSIAASQGLLLNDEDPLQEALTVELTPITPPSHGVLSLDETGQFSYQPDTGYSGSDSFTYRIFNVSGNSAVASVELNVRALPGILVGDSSNITGELLYVGLGELTPNSGIGTGRYRIGNCIGNIDTVCTMLGDYVEGSTSANNPGGGGRYAFTMKYSGEGPSPVIARSDTAGSNSVFFTDTGDATFELSLFPDSGGEFIGQFPADNTAHSIGFSAFITNNESCQGLPRSVPCSIGQAGLVAGSQLTASLDNLQFSVPGGAIGTGANAIPVATDDQYETSVNTSLSVSAPGILLNDSDADTGAVGDTLAIRSQFHADMGELAGLGFDEYKQLLSLYPSSMGGLYIYDSIAQLQNSYLIPGEAANDVDVEIAPQSFMLAGTLVPQGSALVINGETATAEIYALDPVSGTLITQLNSSFGASHVVGGTYNIITSSFFLVQDRVAGGAAGNVVAEIDPSNGQILTSFSVNDAAHPFDVNYGDIEADTYTGNLYLVSSLETGIAEFTPDGDFVREIPLPQAVTGVSGIALKHDGDRIWLSSISGLVYELSFDNGGQMPRLVASIKQAPQHGSLQLNADGSFIYTPDQDFSGQDSFTYLSSDQLGGSSVATVSIDVN